MTRLDMIQLTITRIVLTSGPRVGRRVVLARMYAPVQVAAPRRYRLKGFEAANDDSAQLDRLYQILFARNPDATEKTTLLAFLVIHEKVIKEKAADGKLL
jgi:hypothetical protein